MSSNRREFIKKSAAATAVIGMTSPFSTLKGGILGANEKLEARVEERTAELKAANEQLTHEMAYRKKVEEAQRERTERIIRHQASLLELGKTAELDLSHALRNTTEEVSRTMDVGRASVWFFNETNEALICQDLYQLSENNHEHGMSFKTKDYPRYVQAVEASRIVAADDARVVWVGIDNMEGAG